MTGLYTDAFFALEAAVALRSAAVVLPTIVTPPQHVIDVGCGTGGWAYVAQLLGCTVIGVDYEVPPQFHLIDNIVIADLNDGYDCTGYDLAICLEVAEHLDSGALLVDGLAQADRILFSAATPGQPGVGHINCQPHEHWHDAFAVYGFTPTHIGPLFTDPVADFYRRNMFLYERR